MDIMSRGPPHPRGRLRRVERCASRKIDDGGGTFSPLIEFPKRHPMNGIQKSDVGPVAGGAPAALPRATVSRP
jgi:hypothetical protein